MMSILRRVKYFYEYKTYDKEELSINKWWEMQIKNQIKHRADRIFCVAKKNSKKKIQNKYKCYKSAFWVWLSKWSEWLSESLSLSKISAEINYL